MSGGLCTVFDDVAIVDMVRTPWVDLGGALATVSPIDLAIKAGRAVLARAGSDPQAVGSVLAGSMAQASFDAYFLPRHVGLYCGVPLAVPALAVQRICGTGLELLRQAAEQLRSGAPQVLCVGAESMSRNPIAAYEHRGGFRLGAPVGFKDFLWEALYDPAADVDMIGTADNLAREHGLARETVDAWALRSHQRALQAQQAGWFAEEIVSISSESFFADGYQPRGIELPRGLAEVSRDSHPRPTDAAALARLRTVHPGGVQTAGNSCAVADGAAAAVVAPYASCTRPPLAKLLMATAVGVSPHTMGIGPVPAIELLLRRSGLRADQIDRFEINEAQAAQVVAVAQALQLDVAKLNVHGGAIALGHPLAATGLRLVHTLARQLQQGNLRYGVAAACIGGGQGMALLIENPRFTA
ncbi:MULTISPECIES: thiolase family protein [Pseudomonas]|uniref:Thiolase family protein n=1 Tax=Pseudomonas juntendi TaxID=2666183 RepID=A0AAJ5V1M7_9PSED|nr:MULTISPECIES: thiolase family protein [Pseudomonas]NPA17946.1 thiolase family protein [Gammaproteobacteria bacterium]QOH69270.1 thiolase family protein [Pseudomonas putida]MCK2109328.1 thiolase family protein [Pseudomonas juntendi]MCK2116567.1 thiolase family protein [Pseudomonas juntendi]MCO7056044.1 thiolase family protein [Pseudomonas juntendi]